jgi:hypothetical protein
MKLTRIGREYLTVAISTEPEVTGWEASFDGGTTWTAGEQVGGDWRWLVAGPDVVQDPVVGQVVVSETTTVVLRAIDNPEVLIRKGPRVSIKETV